MSDREPAHVLAADGLVSLSWQSEDRHLILTVLAVAGLLGAGTMALVGLPPVDIHGPLHYMGYMDPFCGITRSTRYAARGDLAEAWRYNPLGIVLVAGAVGVLGRALVGVVSGRWLTWRISWTDRRRHTVIVCVLILLVVLEIRQQLRADLLMTTSA